MSISSPSVPGFGTAVVAVCRSLLGDFFGTYRPERHYMRGPGPKWREKNLVQHLVVRPDRSIRPRFARIRLRV